MLVFVYGTLKRGGSNHDWLRGQRFIGEAATQPHYRLYDLGSYPAMVNDSANGVSVHGEVWEVDAPCLARLDELEDLDSGEYTRELVPLLPPFEQTRVEGYRYLRSVANARDIGTCWQE